MRTNPYYINNYNGQHPFVPTKADIAQDIPYHNAYTTYSPSLLKFGFVPKALAERNPTSIKYTPPKNTGCGPINQTLDEILTINKAMSNPFNTYPFYDDPSVMWTSPQTIYNNQC
jgi:hypothetical protein